MKKRVLGFEYKGYNINVSSYPVRVTKDGVLVPSGEVDNDQEAYELIDELIRQEEAEKTAKEEITPPAATKKKTYWCVCRIGNRDKYTLGNRMYYQKCKKFLYGNQDPMLFSTRQEAEKIVAKYNWDDMYTYYIESVVK